MSDKLRLGGMALPNGVLVHGPSAWACAIRTDDGAVKIASQPKRLVGARISQPWLRGPARLAEAFAVLPALKRALPEAELPLGRGRMALTLVATSSLLGVMRRTRLSATTKELVATALTLAPAVLSLREGSLAAYHGAEHITIGTYEHGVPRAREHERCGTHLVAPLLVTSTAGNLLASRVSARYRSAARLGATLVAVGAATEIFAWMQAHPERRLARTLARPGHEFQHHVATAEPSSAQLEVAQAALAACLELEES